VETLLGFEIDRQSALERRGRTPPVERGDLAAYYRERATECLTRAVEAAGAEIRHDWAQVADGCIHLAKYAGRSE